PQRVSSASVQAPGQSGLRTFYYWIVTNGLSGSSSPAGPFVLPNAPNALGGIVSVSVSWPAVQNAVTYDVLRTPTPVPPTTSCTCAVAIATSSTSISDSSESLSSYTFATNFSNAKMTITHEQYDSTRTALTFRFNQTPIARFLSDGSNSFNPVPTVDPLT